MFLVFLVHLAGLASPGPDFFYVVRQSAKGSVSAGFWATVGISIGIIFWAGLAIFGVGSLNFADHLFQYLMMIFGGFYLAYVGQILLKVKESVKFEDLSSKTTTKKPVFRQIINGLLINIFNAKAGVYFVSVASKFVADFPKLSQHFALLCLFVFTTFAYFCLIALLFSRKPVRKFYEKYSRFVDNSAGIIFILFGIFLIYQGVFAIIS